VGLTPTPI